MKVGIIGLGLIGSAVARVFQRAGYEVVAYDIKPEAFEPLAGIVTVASSLEEVAATCEVVFVAVWGDEEVREVIGAEDGLLGARGMVSSVVILSTVTLGTIRWAAERGQGRGVGIVDCGVTGGQRLLDEGKIVVMVGGDAETVAAVRPYIEVFGDPFLHTGPLGTGMQTKLARNMIVYGQWFVAFEAARLAAAGGVEVDQLVEACKVENPRFGPLGLLEQGFRAGPSNDPATEQWRRRLAGFVHKDLSAALELGDALGVSLPVTELVEQAMDETLGVG